MCQKILQYLLCQVSLLFLTAQNGDGLILSHKQRCKREWVIPSRKVTENVDYSHEPYVARIRSDMGESLYYTLKGPGASEPPLGLFVIEEYKGLVRLTRPLDREEREIYTLNAVAWFNNNTIAEDNIKINITVEDQNDSPPAFIQPDRGSVYEGSPAGTSVMQVVAKDEDQPGTLNSKIAYTLVKQEPYNDKLYFAIDKDKGTIYVIDPTLDREEQSFYMLTLQAADMDGGAEGNVATTAVFIDILDINDNIPTLETSEFSASIAENVAPIEVLKIQAVDSDEERTDNWLAVFEIVSGNKDGRFTVKTDPNTNMGAVFLNEPVDFESLSNLNLSLAVANVAPPGAPLASGARSAGSESSGASEQKTYLLKISVENKRDGPRFDPMVKPISVSEDTQNNSIPRVIATYAALDEDTGRTAENVKYAKGYDPDNWISVNKDTAEITLNKIPDRESPFVVNGTYYAKILSITEALDMYSYTSTGTIALQVENLNDNCPKLTDNVQHICSDDIIVNVTAEDHDAEPYGSPLNFILIPEKTSGRWNLQKITDVSASLSAHEDLWPGLYQITMEIKDSEGLACPDEQVLQLEVCSCSDEPICGKRTEAAILGTSAMALLVLGFLLLLLVPMFLIKCRCGIVGEETFIDMPFETKERFISYNTEALGEDKDVLLMSNIPKLTSGNKIKASKVTSAMGKSMNFKNPEEEIQGPGSNMAANKCAMRPGMTRGGDVIDAVDKQDNPVKFQDIDYVLPDTILNEYFMQKATCISGGAFSEDGMMNYTYEGERSAVGSISTCSCNESNDLDDLEFLNELGSKFHTLAEVCGFKQMPSVPTGSRTDPNVIVSTSMATPAIRKTPITAGSSSHVTGTVQPNPVVRVIRAPSFRTTSNDEMVMQEPTYHKISQPMSNSVLLADNSTSGAYVLHRPSSEGLLTQGNTHVNLGGQQGVHLLHCDLPNIGHSVLDSQIASYIPVVFKNSLCDKISAVIPNISSNQNLVMVQQPTLIRSPQIIDVSEGMVVSGETGQHRANHLALSPQLLYSVNSGLRGLVQ